MTNMMLNQARNFVAMQDAQHRLGALNQAMEDTSRLFDAKDPHGSNKRIATERARIARELAGVALDYSRRLEQFARDEYHPKA